MASASPPRHLIVLGHPRGDSLNHQVAQTYRHSVEECRHEADIRDLYAIGFDPLLRSPSTTKDISDEIDRLRACDALVLVYPIWIGTPPAIIKGYIERVLGAGFDPTRIKAGSMALSCREKHLLTFSTSATTLPWLNERGQWGSLRRAFDSYIAELFGFCSAEHVHFDAVVEGTREKYVREILGRTIEAARSSCAAIGQRRHAAAAQAALEDAQRN